MDLDLEQISVPESVEVRKIRIREFNESWHPDMFGKLDRNTPTLMKPKRFRSIVALHAIEMFDDQNKCVLSAGFFGNKNAKVREFLLDEGERIVGFYSRIERRYAEQAIHRDF